MPASALRVVTYARVSTVEQSSDGLSLDAQQARMRAWAQGAGASVVEEIVDAAVSGAKPLAQRPGGARVAELLNAKSPAADAVVVVRLDRLGRDAAESLALFKRFRTGKVGLVSIAEQVDLATPHGRAMASVQMVFAELERSLLSARTSEALAELRRQGRVLESSGLRLGRRERASGAQRGRAAGDSPDQTHEGARGQLSHDRRATGCQGRPNEARWHLGGCDSSESSSCSARRRDDYFLRWTP